MCYLHQENLREKTYTVEGNGDARNTQPRVLAKVEQRVLATVTSKNQVDSAKKKFQGWRCGINERKPVSEKQMAFG